MPENDLETEARTADGASLSAAFGTLLRRRRGELGLNQSDLALATGVGRRFIIDLEAGKPSCHIGKALLVAEALGIRVIDHIREGTIIRSAVGVATARGAARAISGQQDYSAVTAARQPSPPSGDDDRPDPDIPDDLEDGEPIP